MVPFDGWPSLTLSQAASSSLRSTSGRRTKPSLGEGTQTHPFQRKSSPPKCAFQKKEPQNFRTGDPGSALFEISNLKVPTKCTTTVFRSPKFGCSRHWGSLRSSHVFFALAIIGEAKAMSRNQNLVNVPKVVSKHEGGRRSWATFPRQSCLSQSLLMLQDHPCAELLSIVGKLLVHMTTCICDGVGGALPKLAGPHFSIASMTLSSSCAAFRLSGPVFGDWLPVWKCPQLHTDGT